MVADTRQRLFDAAYDCFSELGYEGSSARIIAQRAGANVAAINYHFGSKEQLWAAVCERAAARCTELFVGGFDPGMDVAPLVARVLGALFDGFVADPRPLRIAVWLSLQADAVDFAATAGVFQPLVHRGMRHLVALRDSGELGEIDVEAVVCLCYGQFLVAFIDQPGQRLYFGRDFSDREHAARIRRALIRSALTLLGLDPRDAGGQLR